MRFIPLIIAVLVQAHGAAFAHSVDVEAELDKLSAIMARMNVPIHDRPIPEYLESIKALVEAGHFYALSIHDIRFPVINRTTIANDADKSMWEALEGSPHILLWHEGGYASLNEDGSGINSFRITGVFTKLQIASITHWLKGRREDGEEWRWRVTIEGGEAERFLLNLASPHHE